MPGLVKSVNVTVGELVNEGQEVLVIGKQFFGYNLSYNLTPYYFYLYRGYEDAKQINCNRYR